MPSPELAPKVFSHQFVLKDSLPFIRMIDTLNTPFNDNLRFATYDVTALYPSIDLERGLKSLEWFLGAECNFNNELSDFIFTFFTFCSNSLLYLLPRDQREYLSPSDWHRYGNILCGSVCNYTHDSNRDRHLQTI